MNFSRAFEICLAGGIGYSIGIHGFSVMTVVVAIAVLLSLAVLFAFVNMQIGK